MSNTLTEPRQHRINNVELNWPKLVKAVSPFGELQWELQIATTDEAVAKEWADNFLKVNHDKESGKYSVNLKRKATYKSRDSGALENNTPVKVVDHNVNPIDATRLGNGSKGNVLLWQRPYENKAAKRKGISTILTGVQVTKFVAYEGAIGFEPVESEGTVTAQGEDFAPTGVESDEPVKVEKKKKGTAPKSAEDLVKDWE